MPTEFDSCVRKVIKQGKGKDSAFAICTSEFKKAGKKYKENIDEVILEDQPELQELKKDEDGNIIVAENVKMYIGADIVSIEE